MLVDENGIFITQREVPEMALLQLGPRDNGWKIRHKSRDITPLEIPFEVSRRPEIQVQIFKDTCMALRVDKEIDQWFQQALGLTCHLVYMPDDAQRQIDLKYAKPGEVVSFADGYPYLLLSQASLDGLNARLEEPVPMNRFRPNLVISGVGAHEEDKWKEIQIGEVRFGVPKPCARCVVDHGKPGNGNQRQRTLVTPFLLTASKALRYCLDKICFGVLDKSCQ